MTADTYVDLTYRGLALGRRVKLGQVRPSTAYLELPAPMPVGTTIGILTDDTVALDAQVVAIHEQVAGSELPPGMLVRPRLAGDVATAWWQQRVTLPELPPRAPKLPAPPVVAPPIVAKVMPKRRTLDGVAAVPELVDDGMKTSVMEVVDPDEASIPIAQDDGRATVAMSAVDLAALGLDPNAATTTGSIPVQPAPGEGDDDEPDGNGNGNGNGEKPDAKSPKKKRRRR